MSTTNRIQLGKVGARANTRVVAPSPSPTPTAVKDEGVGSWLCNEGPYRDYIAALSRSNPGLGKQDPNNQANPLTDTNALVVLLEAPSNGSAGFTRTEFVNPQELRKHFDSTDDNHDRRRVYVMEGLAKDYISVLGGHFFMDPTFFLRQERTCVWSNDFTPTSDALPHPSLLDPENMFHLQYCELRQFSKAIENRYYFCQRTRRHVGMTPPRHKEESTTGILRRKVSWWSQTTSNGGWDAVILCDPQLDKLNPEPNEYDPETRSYKKIKLKDTLKNTSFQDGYIDFLPTPSRDRAFDKPPHPHSSMLRDLIHYFEHHSDLLGSSEWNSPATSTFFVKKIVAAHYLQLVDYIKAMLPSLELRLTTAWVEEQEQWKSLQTISRRCGNYSDDVEDTLLSLGYPLDALQSHGHRDWRDCKKDFQYIYFRLKILKSRADTLMQSMTGLASIAGNRQNLEEAKRVKRLNLLALLFIPLAYTSSLFSMQDTFAPGNGKFWVYWICALGVVALTLIMTWILDSALDEAAQWTWTPLFRLWGKGNRMVRFVPKPKRRTTGFWDH